MSYCCMWCHATLSGRAYVNRRTLSTVCGSCRVDPVLNGKSKCRRPHKLTRADAERFRKGDGDGRE
jgi:hypothetical protein